MLKFYKSQSHTAVNLDPSKIVVPDSIQAFHSAHIEKLKDCCFAADPNKEALRNWD